MIPVQCRESRIGFCFLLLLRIFLSLSLSGREYIRLSNDGNNIGQLIVLKDVLHALHLHLHCVFVAFPLYAMMFMHL